MFPQASSKHPIRETSVQAQPARDNADTALRFATMDVEEYFHIEAARTAIPRAHWDRRPSRLDCCTQLLLELLDRRARCGTFFFLGDVARHRPYLARRVAAAGHEIACHGMNHDRPHRLDRESF